MLGLPGLAGVEGWKVLHIAGVPALEVPFMDLRGVATWCEAAAEGIDPAMIQTSIRMPDGTQQPNFLMNYPPVVLALRHVGLDSNSIGLLGVLLALVYAGAVFYLMGRIGLRAGWVWLLLFLSPLSVLLVERANLDILVFALFALALALRGQPALAGVSILAAGAFKLYPAAGLAALAMRPGWKGVLFAVAGVGLFCVYLACCVPGLGSIGGSLAHQYKSCFGSDVAWDILSAHGVSLGVNERLVSFGLKVGAAISCLVAIVVGFLMAVGSPGCSVSGRSSFAFWLSAPMLIVLFLLSNQMDYKWTFYLFMVPAVLEMVDSSGRFERGLGRFWLASLLIYSYWTFFSGEESLRNALWKQGVMWLVFLATCGLAGMLLKSHLSKKSHSLTQ